MSERAVFGPHDPHEFLDGATPDDVSQTAVSGVFTEQTKDNSNAFTLKPISGTTGFVLLTVSAVFAIL